MDNITKTIVENEVSSLAEWIEKYVGNMISSTNSAWVRGQSPDLIQQHVMEHIESKERAIRQCIQRIEDAVESEKKWAAKNV